MGNSAIKVLASPVGVILRARGDQVSGKWFRGGETPWQETPAAGSNPAVVQGPQQLRGTELSRQKWVGPDDSRGLGLGGGWFPGDQTVVLKAGVGTLLRTTTAASQPASLRDPSSDKVETQKRRL